MIHRYLKLLVLLVALTAAAGCTYHIRPEEMVPDVPEAPRTLGETVRVDVLMAAEPESDSPGGESEDLTSRAFDRALQAALKRTGLFRHILLVWECDYRLKVHVLEVDYSGPGLGMTVVVKAKWILTSGRAGKVIWEEDISGECRLGPLDNLDGGARRRSTIEGAARENIRQGILRLATLIP